MTNECIADWLRNIKEKYIHGGNEELDARRRLVIDSAIDRLRKQQEEINHLKAERDLAARKIADLKARARIKMKLSEGTSAYYTGTFNAYLTALEIVRPSKRRKRNDNNP